MEIAWHIIHARKNLAKDILDMLAGLARYIKDESPIRCRKRRNRRRRIEHEHEEEEEQQQQEKERRRRKKRKKKMKNKNNKKKKKRQEQQEKRRGYLGYKCLMRTQHPVGWMPLRQQIPIHLVDDVPDRLSPGSPDRILGADVGRVHDRAQIDAGSLVQKPPDLAWHERQHALKKQNQRHPLVVADPLVLDLQILRRNHLLHRNVVRVADPADRVRVVDVALGEFGRTPAVDRGANGSCLCWPGRRRGTAMMTVYWRLVGRRSRRQRGTWAHECWARIWKAYPSWWVSSSWAAVGESFERRWRKVSRVLGSEWSSLLPQKSIPTTPGVKG